MNNEITPFLGLMDFVPVTVMVIGLLILNKSVKPLVRKSTSIMLVISAVIIWIGAGTKATHKTIIGLSGNDIEFMYRTFWVALAIGYFWLFAALIRISGDLKNKDAGSAAYATMPLKPVFMLLQTIGLFGSYAMMLRFAIKLKSKAGTAMFIISLVLIPVQLYMGSIFNDTSALHWIAQSVNFLSTVFFTGGVLVIRNRMSELKAK